MQMVRNRSMVDIKALKLAVVTPALTLIRQRTAIWNHFICAGWSGIVLWRRDTARRAMAAATVLTGYTGTLDNLLRASVTNSTVCFEQLQKQGYTRSRTTRRGAWLCSRAAGAGDIPQSVTKPIRCTGGASQKSLPSTSVSFYKHKIKQPLKSEFPFGDRIQWLFFWFSFYKQ